MKLSTNFVKDYVDIDVDVKTLAEDMTSVGNEYDEAGKLINATNLVIGEVKKCEMHPDSDHLHICKVDVGNEILNIVCGAPNVKKGQKVIVALAGAELPNGIKIKKGMIRGQESNGMICSLSEIGIESKFQSEEDKTGIHVLGNDAIPGEDPIKYMGLDDEIIDFDLTANRGDLLSILGMAYEIGAIYDKNVKDIDLSHKENENDINDTFKLDIKTDNCKIFLAKRALNVEIKESPTFIKNRLLASGIRPINNVVDISNYVMLETGQPLHFYNADSLKGKIEVRMAEDNEKLTTLDGIERNLTNDDIVISDGERAIGLAGVMGGLDTEIENDTKNVIIEAAIFDGVKVRLTSKKIVRSEASNRFEKGLDSNRTYMAIERACTLLEKYANATISKGTCVYDKTEKEDKKIDITLEKINNLLGSNISLEEVLNIFRRLGFKTESKQNSITVFVPRRRIDIEIQEDLIEEVGRIYGVNNIEAKLPVVPTIPGNYDKRIRNLRNKIISLGLNETLSYILLNEKEVNKFTKDIFEPIKLLDPMSEDRNTLRYSMIPSLLKIYEYNAAHENKDVSIFEIGKGFYKHGEEYGEDEKLCILMSGEFFKGIDNRKQVDFYILKGIVEEILDSLGYENRYSFVKPKDIPEEFHPGQTADIIVNGKKYGIMGLLHPEVTENKVFVCEINLSKLFELKTGKMKYKEISKFPGSKKDLSIVVDKNIESLNIAKVMKKAGGNNLTSVEAFDVYEGKGIEEGKKSLAFSLTFGSQDKTLTDEEINPAIEKIIQAVEKEFKAELRK